MATSINGQTGNITKEELIADLGDALGGGGASGFNGLFRRATTRTGTMTLVPPSLPVDLPVDAVDTVLGTTSSGAVSWDDTNKVAVINTPGMYWVSTQLAYITNIDDAFTSYSQLAITGTMFETSLGPLKNYDPSVDGASDAGDRQADGMMPFGNLETGWRQANQYTDPDDVNAWWQGNGGVVMFGEGATVGLELIPYPFDPNDYPTPITYDSSQTAPVEVLRATFIVAKLA